MGKGGKQEQQKTVYTWDEIAKHDKREDRWMVIQGEVYNITNWARKHPGGTKVISHYSGQDATVSKVIIIHKGGTKVISQYSGQDATVSKVVIVHKGGTKVISHYTCYSGQDATVSKVINCT